jgi:hypothetical protein
MLVINFALPCPFRRMAVYHNLCIKHDDGDELLIASGQPILLHLRDIAGVPIERRRIRSHNPFIIFGFTSMPGA